MPWELLLDRLDRYLRTVYVMNVVCGMAFSFEVLIFALDGPPAARRAQIRALLQRALDLKPTTLQIVLAVALVIIVSFAVGIVLQRGVSMTVNLLLTMYAQVRTAISDLPPTSRVRSIWARMQPFWRRMRISWGSPASQIDSSQDRSDLGRQWSIRSSPLAQLFLGPYLTGEAIWGLLLSYYREDKIRTALDNHPLRISINGPDHEIFSAYEYCSKWLERYARDLATPTLLQNLTVPFLTVVPALLAPYAVAALWGDDRESIALSDWFDLFLLIYLIYFARKLLASLTSGNYFMLETFRRWILAQLLEGGKPTGHNEEPLKAQDSPTNSAPPG